MRKQITHNMIVELRHWTPRSFATMFAWMILLAATESGSAQYSVAPNAFVIQAPSRSTEMYIKMAPDASPMEFNISSFFAIPVTDSLGNFRLETNDSLLYRDATPFLRFSPRRFVLNAGEQQIVRISVLNDSLPDGEYWSRVMTSAKLIHEHNDALETFVSASIGLEIRTVSGFIYRKGSQISDIAIDQASAFLRGDSLFIDLDITKKGISAWLGTLDVEITDLSGNKSLRKSLPTNVYRGAKYRYVFTPVELSDGVHAAKVTMRSIRDDPTLPIIPAPSVVRMIPLTATSNWDQFE